MICRETTPERTSARDPAVDLLRGAALWIIHADHFRSNVVASLTPRNFGFSDMADVFVVLSGCACGVAYRRADRSGGGPACRGKAARRAVQLALACALTLLALRAVHAAFGRDEGLGGRRPPASGSWLDGVGHVEGAPLVLGILSLYVALTLALPAMIRLQRIHWLALFLPSLILYGASRGAPAPAPLVEPWRAVTHFHPLAWQFPFALGILAYEPLRSGRMGRGSGRLLPFAALAVVELAFLCRMALPASEIPLMDKETAGPLRILHVLGLMVLAFTLLPGPGASLYDAPPIRALTLCGRHPLVVFCVGTVFIALLDGPRVATQSGPIAQVAAVALVWGGCVVAAVLWRRVQRLGATPAPRPGREGCGPDPGIGSAGPGGIGHDRAIAPAR